MIARWSLVSKGTSHFFADNALHILVALEITMLSGFLVQNRVMPDSSFKPTPFRCVA